MKLEDEIKNELRIGNLLFYGERIVKVIAIFRTHFICDEVDTGIQIGNSLQENFNPIPLTEEWLLKLGFDNINSKEYGIKCGSCWMSLSNPKDMGEWQDCYCWIFDRFKFIELKYVHQLQNLYFALTGNELEINKEDENK